MSIVARRVRATPERAATEAWAVIVDLISANDSSARHELRSISGIASALISTESPKDAPIVVCGTGPRVRIYCLYDDEAVSGDEANEAKLAQCPTEEDWVMSLPADLDDISWMREALEKRTKRVTVRDKSTSFEKDSEDSKSQDAQDVAINMEAFLRP